MLNVWTPPSAKNLPVMFYVHGGSFIMGSGAQFNGTKLALDQNVVVVTINYRLMSFGFFASSEQLGRKETTGNFGLQDQREGLRWVQKQIASFGGDPAQVTLFGESAGAISVQLHLLNNRSKGLYRSAISESGFASTRSQDYAVDVSDRFAAKLGCGKKDVAQKNSSSATPVLDCLRGLDAATITKADVANSSNPFVAAGWQPVTDGVEFVESALKALVTGNFDLTGVASVTAGSNNDEGTLFVYPTHKLPMSKNAYETAVHEFVTAHGNPVPLNASEWERLHALYPAQTEILGFHDNRPTLAQLMGDGTFICGSQLLLHFLRKHSGVPTFIYHFDYVRRSLCSGFPKSWGATHGTEIPFVWDTPEEFSTLCHSFNSTGVAVGSTMRREWGSVARTGRPSSVWPEFDTDTKVFARFGDSHEGGAHVGGGQGMTTERAYKAEQCQFWADYYERAAMLGGI